MNIFSRTPEETAKSPSFVASVNIINARLAEAQIALASLAALKAEVEHAAMNGYDVAGLDALVERFAKEAREAIRVAVKQVSPLTERGAR